MALWWAYWPASGFIQGSTPDSLFLWVCDRIGLAVPFFGILIAWEFLQLGDTWHSDRTFLGGGLRQGRSPAPPPVQLYEAFCYC